MTSLTVDIATTHIRGRLRQTLLSTLGTATGVGFAVAMAALMQGSQADFIQRIVDATPHVAVRDEFREPPVQPVERAYSAGAVALQGQKPKEEVRGIRNPHARLAAIAGMTGLTVAPTLRGQVVVRYGGKDLALSLVGIEPAREKRVSQLVDDMVTGSLDDLYIAANGIVIGEGVARKLSAEPGSTLAVTSPSGVLLKMKVVGTFRAGIAAIDDGTGYALLKKVQVLLERPNVVNEIRIRVEPAEDARLVARRIEGWLGYRTESWDEANEGVLEVFVIRNTIMYTVVGSILLVAAFGIFNIISTITHEKAQDIAILKSLGFREADIRRIFLFEGLAIGAAGTLLGSALGYGLYRLLGSITVAVPGRGGPTPLPVIYEPLHYLIAGGCAIAAAVLASYLPARRAARLNPVDIIRGAA
jgi:lipoprotein-releasing system permease protein